MKEIIFATTNKGKLKEVQAIFENSEDKIIIKSLLDMGINIDILEDGKTFTQNAIKKATEISKLTKLPVIADDSGLEIDCLNKEPGIYSARYLGVNTPYDIKNAKIIERVQKFSIEKRTARFVSAVAFVNNGLEPIIAIGTIEGIIHDKSTGEGGFGYDPIFFIPTLNKTMAQLSVKEKNKISHRGKAFRQMKDLLKKVM